MRGEKTGRSYGLDTFRIEDNRPEIQIELNDQLEREAMDGCTKGTPGFKNTWKAIAPSRARPLGRCSHPSRKSRARS